MWPKQSERDSFYGNPRGKNGKASILWEATNLTLVKPPFAMYFAGQRVSGVRVHKKCAASLARVFEAIWQASGKSQATIDKWGVSIYGGAYNYRLVRGGNTLSSHSWGCAIDLDPARNGFGDSTPNFANIPAVLDAFRKEGWVWGGKWSKTDGMHWQAAIV